MSTDPSVRTARTTGLLYLGIALTGLLGHLLVRSQLFDADDPANDAGPAGWTTSRWLGSASASSWASSSPRRSPACGSTDCSARSTPSRPVRWRRSASSTRS